MTTIIFGKSKLQANMLKRMYYPTAISMAISERKINILLSHPDNFILMEHNNRIEEIAKDNGINIKFIK